MAGIQAPSTALDVAKLDTRDWRPVQRFIYSLMLQDEKQQIVAALNLL